MLQNLAALLKVKSIITLTIIGGVTYGFIAGTVPSEAYCGFAGSVITYYFTKQEVKQNADGSNK
jgi:uncharacterized membrane protein YdjX (TVP38/TMEM64 family)